MTTRGNAGSGARGPALAVTIRIGLADAAGHVTGRETLVAADTRLHETKRAGRNRVC